MKGVVLERGTGGRGLRAVVADLRTPGLSPGDILVDMKACGLCGTDLEKLRGEYTASSPVLGHEAVGVVSAVAGKTSGIRVGDRVFPHHHVPCGRCGLCRWGSQTMCQDYRKSNLDPGGFSEAFRVPSWNVRRGGVLRLPDKFSFDDATMVEPVACCLRAIRRCGVSSGDTVLVVGAGPVGISHAIVLRSMGAVVLLSDFNESRLAFARRMGVEDTLGAGDDLHERVSEATDGRGTDFTIVAAGSPEAVVQGLRSVRRGGTLCLFGVPMKGRRLEYDLSDIYNSEVSIVSSYGATETETREALKLLSSGRVRLGKLVTAKYRLEDFGDAVKAAEGGHEMKVLLTP